MANQLMMDFPPPEEMRVTLANWRKPPFNKWSFQHVRELIPTADILNDPDNIRPLPKVHAGGLAGLSIKAEGRTSGAPLHRLWNRKKASTANPATGRA